MHDTEILSLFFARSEQAITALAAKYGGVLTYTARSILHNDQDAEECVSDGYLAVWNTVPPKRPDPLLGYVLRIVRNRCLDRLRQRGAQKRDNSYDLALDELSELLPDRETVEDRFDVRELGRSIDRFLDTLPQEDRILFLRRYWFGESVSELARELGRSENQLSVRLFRIRERLKNHLVKEGIAV